MSTSVVIKKKNSKGKYYLSSYTDQAWKEALNLFFKEFMELFWLHIYQDIDWDKGYEILEQELHRIIFHSKKGKSIDKLIKVYRKNGLETCILLHFELQGEKEAEFSNRLFTYHYRLLERYAIPVVTLGVLIDPDLDWRPLFL